MEIERKFTVRQLPEDLARYDSHLIEQGYLNTNRLCVSAERTIPIISPIRERGSWPGRNIIFL